MEGAVAVGQRIEQAAVHLGVVDAEAVVLASASGSRTDGLTAQCRRAIDAEPVVVLTLVAGRHAVLPQRGTEVEMPRVEDVAAAGLSVNGRAVGEDARSAAIAGGEVVVVITRAAPAGELLRRSLELEHAAVRVVAVGRVHLLHRVGLPALGSAPIPKARSRVAGGYSADEDPDEGRGDALGLPVVDAEGVCRLPGPLAASERRQGGCREDVHVVGQNSIIIGVAEGGVGAAADLGREGAGGSDAAEVQWVGREVAAKLYGAAREIGMRREDRVNLGIAGGVLGVVGIAGAARRTITVHITGVRRRDRRIVYRARHIIDFEAGNLAALPVVAEGPDAYIVVAEAVAGPADLAPGVVAVTGTEVVGSDELIGVAAGAECHVVVGHRPAAHPA